jgi:very-short-patch-repair endonuclease
MGKIYSNKNLKEYARDLRNNSTLGEIILWKRVLRARKFYGYQFNRQFILGNYIVDFICRKLNLIIEIDGYSHQFTYQKDINKDKYLKDIGYRVLRFKESEVKHQLDDVVWRLEKFLENDIQD